MIGSVVLAAALLLAGAGAAKIVAPRPAAAMLRRAWPALARTAGLPLAVRIGGAGELLIGVAVAAVGGRLPAALLAGCYAVFAVVAVRPTLAGGRTSCGCFGRADAPVGPAHVALNLVAVTAGVAAAVRPSGPLGGRLDGEVLTGLVGVAQAGLLAYLGFLSITALPALGAERRRASA